MRIYFLILIVGFTAILCENAKSTNTDDKKKGKSHFVVIETKYGNMKILLYNETPLHRDNFLKLVNEKFYDSLLFHRVIKDFMIQGGDPGSKGARAEVALGAGNPGYDIDAEFSPNLYHKKGALAAAREGDNVNPDKKSSGSQFYIVEGTVFTLENLAQMEEKINQPKKQKVFYEYVSNPENAQIKFKLDSLNSSKSYEALNQEIQQLLDTLAPDFEKLGLFHFSEEQKQAYTSIGGTPHLDQSYTVFGEVIEGLNVVDSICNVKTGRNDRPIDDIIMKIKVVKK